MRRLDWLIPSVCVIGVLCSSTPAALPPDQPKTITPPMDVLYAAPGDANYAYGPKGADLAALTAGDRPANANFSVTYNGFSPQAQLAFQAAIDIWSATLVNSAPIRIVANWTNLGSTGILGSAGATVGCQVPGGLPSTYYAAALADKINGSAFCAAAGGQTSEIIANFNSTFPDWEFGTTGVGVPGKYNFMTVVMHEVGHGLGFFGRFTSAGGVGSIGSFVYVYDRFAVTGANAALTTITNPSAALHAQLTSNNTFWNTSAGPKLETHNMTTQYGRSSDNGWLQGSSYSHLDDVQYSASPNGLMTFQLASNEVYTDPGPVVKTIFLNEGWSVFATTPHIAGDFDGNGTADFAVFRPSTGQWFISGGTTSAFGQTGDIPIPADYNGDGRTEIGVYRPSTGQWLFQAGGGFFFGQGGDIPVLADYAGNGVPEAAVFRGTDGATAMTWVKAAGGTTTFGQRGDIPLPADYDGDLKADLAVYRPRTGQWFVLNSSTGTTTATSWGQAGDIPVPGKYDNDAGADLVVYRPSTGAWYLKLSAGGTSSVVFGQAGDVPMALDVNGDGQAELTLFRPSTGTWYAYNRMAGTFTTQSFGAVGDIPVMQRPRLPSAPASDFDGDGISDVTVFRPSSGTWFTKTSSTGFATSTSMPWGQSGDVRVAGDYDGDHRTDHAIYRPSTGEWFIRRSSSATLLYALWGASGDVPVAGDYDGDSRTDMAVYRPSTGAWFVLLSSTNYATSKATLWGLSGDLPIVGDFDGDGLSDQMIYRPSNGSWILKPSSTGYGSSVVRTWGLAGDTAIAGDFDGDGRTDLNIYRPSNGAWFAEDVLLASALINGPTGLVWGVSSDTPVPHDFDGDGAADPAVFRPATGEWFVRRSTNGTLLLIPWGTSGDGPLLRKDGISRP